MFSIEGLSAGFVRMDALSCKNDKLTYSVFLHQNQENEPLKPPGFDASSLMCPIFEKKRGIFFLGVDFIQTTFEFSTELFCRNNFTTEVMGISNC